MEHAYEETRLLIPGINSLSGDIQRARGFDSISPEALVLEEIEQELTFIDPDKESDAFGVEIRSLQQLISLLVELPSASANSAD